MPYQNRSKEGSVHRAPKTKSLYFGSRKGDRHRQELSTSIQSWHWVTWDDTRARQLAIRAPCALEMMSVRLQYDALRMKTPSWRVRRKEDPAIEEHGSDICVEFDEQNQNKTPFPNLQRPRRRHRLLFLLLIPRCESKFLGSLRVLLRSVRAWKLTGSQWTRVHPLTDDSQPASVSVRGFRSGAYRRAQAGGSL